MVCGLNFESRRRTSIYALNKGWPSLQPNFSRATVIGGISSVDIHDHLAFCFKRKCINAGEGGHQLITKNVCGLSV